jgi:hypothetical protein
VGFFRRAVRVVVSFGAVVVVVACGSGPSKREAMDAIGREATMDALCTLPIDILSQLRMQHATKGMCAPKDDPATPKVKKCLDALVAAHLTQLKPAAYMREWPDDVAARSLSDVPAYERKSRDLVYSTCWELSEPRLRQGQFVCAKATNEKIIDMTKIDEAHVDVKVAQKISPGEDLASIDAACGGNVTKPPADLVIRIEKTSAGWAPTPSSSDPSRPPPVVGH